MRRLCWNWREGWQHDPRTGGCKDLACGLPYAHIFFLGQYVSLRLFLDVIRSRATDEHQEYRHGSRDITFWRLSIG